MLKLFQNAPAFRFIIFLFIGFFFQKIISIPFDWIYPVITTIVLIAVILSILKKFSISVLLLLFAFGIFTSFRTYNLDFNYSGNFPPQIKGHFQGKVINKLKVKGKTSRYILEGDLILNDFQKIPKTRLHFTLINQQNLPLEFEEGNTIFAKIQYRIPNQATLPNEFDEKSYYRSIDIHYTAFAFTNEIAILDNGKKQNIIQLVNNSIKSKIEELYSPITQGIVKAILLGDKKSIPQEIRQNFALSGTAHILAVSGLHVGLISMIIYWLFSFIKVPWLKFSIFSVTLWSYAVLTGLNPSVVRASLMIMIYLLAKTIQRKPNPINVISIAALVIIIVSPQMIYSAGFQMSFAAILGIILLNEKFVKLLGKNKLLSKDTFFPKFIKSSLAMTLSATIIVSPIVAYYFKTISVISPLANLIIIPAMVLAQSYAIMAVIASYFWMPFAGALATTSQLLIEISQTLTKFATYLPGSFFIGENTFIISVFASTIILLFITVKNIRQFSFRLIYVSISIVFIYFAYTNYSNKELYKKYERPSSNYYEIHNNSIAVIEENSVQTGRGYDYGLFIYLNNLKDDKKVFFSGKTGEILSAKILNPKIKWINLKEKELKQLTSTLFNKN